MEKRIALFIGTDKGEYGMPAPIHFYAIFASHYAADKTLIAVTTMTVSENTQSQNPPTRLIKAKSEEEAIELAIADLSNFPSNKGLTLQVSHIPNIKL